MGESEAQLDLIAETTDCSREFRCYRSGLEDPSKVKRLGQTGLIDCLDTGIYDCSYGVSFGFGRFCTCPVRAHILKHLGR